MAAKMKMVSFRDLVWEDIGRDLSKESEVSICLCLGKKFGDYLQKRRLLPFRLRRADYDYSRGEGDDPYKLIIGWEVIREGHAQPSLQMIYKALAKGGEAQLFGFYSHPVAEALLLWERKLREWGRRRTLPRPLPGAVSLAEVSTHCRTSPFQHYVISKKEIYYRARLRK